MYGNLVSLHITEAFPRIDQGENKWELMCYECGFRARITNGLNSGEDQFEILDIGDPEVRHSGSNGNVLTRSGLKRLPRSRQDDDGAWLTAESRQKLNEILLSLD